MRDNRFRIIPACREVEYPLREFFEEVKDNKFFHPHPLTAEEASNKAWYNGRDLYYVVTANERIFGYGFLRGWDDNWENICLGLIIRGGNYNIGLGKLLVRFLHAAARERGVKKLRLKVNIDNLSAMALYLKMGYRFDGEKQNGELIGYYDLHNS